MTRPANLKVPLEASGSMEKSPDHLKLSPAPVLAVKEYGLSVPGRVVKWVRRTLMGVTRVLNALGPGQVGERDGPVVDVEHFDDDARDCPPAVQRASKEVTGRRTCCEVELPILLECDLTEGLFEADFLETQARRKRDESWKFT